MISKVNNKNPYEVPKVNKPSLPSKDKESKDSGTKYRVHNRTEFKNKYGDTLSLSDDFFDLISKKIPKE